MVLHRLRPSLLYLSLTEVKPELSKDTFEVSLFVSRKKEHARGFSSLHTRFLPFSKLLSCIFFWKNMQQCLWDGTCSWHVPKKQWVQRQQLKVGGHFSEKTSTWDTKHLIPNGLGVPVTANGATVNWKCRRQGADFWSQLGGQITAAEAASPGGGGEVLSITLSSVHKSELSSVETLPYQIPPAAISCRGLRLL